MRLVSVPLGPRGSLARPGEQVEGQPQDVSEAVQLTLTHVEAVQRLVSLEDLTNSEALGMRRELVWLRIDILT